MALHSCLHNLHQIEASLELLHRFFKELHTQIEELSHKFLPTFLKNVSEKSLSEKKLDVS